MKATLATLHVPLLLAPSLLAQGGNNTRLNEIYASHSGTDTEEFIELKGTPNASLAGLMVLVVEGEDPVFGTLDRVWDLSSFSMPADGYFVLGDTAVANVDLNIGTQDSIENGTETFYLVSTTDTAAINSLLGMNVDPDGDLVTMIAQMGTVTILDLVAIIETNPTDRVYDGAPIYGPDGMFLPAGIYRGNDFPNTWCSNFLDFNLGVDRTPGASNVSCVGGEPGTKYCTANANSTGAPADISGSGSASVAANNLTLAAQPVPNQPGIFFHGATQTNVTFGNGILCASGGIVRGSVIIASGNTIQYVYDDSTSQQTLDTFVGQTRNFQYWYRDPMAGGAFFNTSNAYSIALLP